MSVHSSMTSGQFGFSGFSWVPRSPPHWWSGGGGHQCPGAEVHRRGRPLLATSRTLRYFRRSVVAVSVLWGAAVASTLIAMGWFRRTGAFLLLLGAALGDFFVGALGFGTVLVAPVVAAFADPAGRAIRHPSVHAHMDLSPGCESIGLWNVGDLGGGERPDTHGGCRVRLPSGVSFSWENCRWRCREAMDRRGSLC